MTQESTDRISNESTSCSSECFSSELGVPMHINGNGPYLASVDTGAGRTVILPEIAEELGLEKVGSEERRGAGGPVTIDLMGITSISAGSVEAQLETIGVSSALKNLCGRHFQGNIGYDVLRHGRLIADFSKERMVLEPGDTTPIDGVPFELGSAEKPLVILNTTVDGSGPYRFVVDTGAMATCISPQLARAVAAGKGTPLQVAGVGGQLEGYFTEKPLKLVSGGQGLGEVNAVVIDIFGSLTRGKSLNLSGIIGQDIMRQFVVTFDYPHGIICFE